MSKRNKQGGPEEKPTPKEQLRVQRRLSKRIYRLGQDLEKFNIGEYMNLLNNPKRFMLVNFMGGVARGLGFGLGATVFAALLLYFLQRLVVLNLPLIGDFIADIVRIVQNHL